MIFLIRGILHVSNKIFLFSRIKNHESIGALRIFVTFATFHLSRVFLYRCACTSKFFHRQSNARAKYVHELIFRIVFERLAGDDYDFFVDTSNRDDDSDERRSYPMRNCTRSSVTLHAYESVCQKLNSTRSINVERGRDVFRR